MYDSGLAYEIDPRRFRLDRFQTVFLSLFWIIWTPVTLALTAFALSGEGPQAFLWVWLCFGWIGVLIIPWALLTRKRRQYLEARSGRLIVRGTGLLPGSRLEIDAPDLEALALGRYGEESIDTLNLIVRKGRFPKRILLANMVNSEGKRMLFEEIDAFLRAAGFDHEARRGSFA